MLSREIIALYSEKHMEPVIQYVGKMQGVLMLKQVVSIFTTVL
jgi:hypothetical protein